MSATNAKGADLNETAARRRRRDGAKQRQRMKDAAVRLFSARGFQATTVRRITARVSLQAGSLYHYFMSKQDLLREICVDFASRSQAKAEAVLQAIDDPVDLVAALLRAGIENTFTYPEASQVLRTEARALRRHQRALVADAVRLHRMRWIRAIEKGVDQGVFHCPDPRLAAIIITQIEDVSAWYSPTGRLTKGQLIQKLTGFVLRILEHQCDERCVDRTYCQTPARLETTVAEGLRSDAR